MVPLHRCAQVTRFRCSDIHEDEYKYQPVSFSFPIARQSLNYSDDNHFHPESRGTNRCMTRCTLYAEITYRIKEYRHS